MIERIDKNIKATNMGMTEAVQPGKPTEVPQEEEEPSPLPQTLPERQPQPTQPEKKPEQEPEPLVPADLSNGESIG